MSIAVIKAMLKELARDRGSLAMTFILPVAFFLVFATIFASASGEDARIYVAFADEVESRTSKRLVETLARDPSVVAVGSDDLPQDEARALVRRGSADVAVIVRTPLNGASLDGEPAILLVGDPTREVAISMVAGRVQQSYFEAAPDVALGNVARILDPEFVELTDDQRHELRENLALLSYELDDTETEDDDVPADDDEPVAVAALYDTEMLSGRTESANHVAYYAGAVAVLFVLFSAANGAMALFDERDAGILDRLLAGPSGMALLVRAKFSFLTVQGFAQVLVIFLAASLLYEVDIVSVLPEWTVVTVAVAAAASGLALALAAACSNRRQAQTLANVAILIVSAVGGSMVPRFFMPPFLRDLGWLTPNTWALEAYTALLWRGESLVASATPVLLLLASAGLGLALAQRLATRWETL